MREVDVRLPGRGNSKSHGVRPVLLIITMIKWIRTSRLCMKNSLSYGLEIYGLGVWSGRSGRCSRELGFQS